MSPRTFAGICFAALVGPALAAPAELEPRGAPPLVVVITVDQFRADYLARFREHFAPGGLRRLLEQGVQFVDCRYRHAVTKTAAGHAVVLTGVHANLHGIINNAWIDRDTLRKVNCVDDSGVQILGRAEDRGAARRPGTTAAIGASPRRLLASTVGDELKLTRGGRSKVIGLSSKDRSAILLAGKLADAAYWMDKGRMVTSTHYLKELPEWVRSFNDAGRVDAYFGRMWDRLLPVAAYEKLQGPDDAPGEFGDFGLGQTFPRRVDGGSPRLGAAYYDAFELTPFKSEVLLEFARTVVEQEKLGQRGVTDLLCLSFSVNDSIGHAFGPESHEVMDITLRTDRMLAEFFAFLDRHLGAGRFLVVLTADHGVAPVPEQVTARHPGLSAGRIDHARLLRTCEAALDRAFGPLTEGRRWLVADENALLFQRGVCAERNVAPEKAEQVVREALRSLEFVEAAWTRTELLAGPAAGEYGGANVLSYHRERSGDVVYQLKPYWVDRKTGTNHGTPYAYDVHVPLLWYGPGVPSGVRTDAVGVDDIAPTLARLLGLPAPPMARGRVLF